MGRRRVDLQEAAELLGISSDAVRKRAKRGTMPYETGTDGKLYVWVDSGETEAYTPGADPVEPKPGPSPDQAALVEALREQVAYLQGVIATRDRELNLRAEEIRRRDSALEREQELAAMFANRLRQLEAPQDEPQAPQTPPEEPTDTEPRTEEPEPQTESSRPSFWRRFFGLE